MVNTLINGTALSAYHADLLDYSVSGVPYKDNYVTPINGYFPIAFGGTYGERTVTLKLDFTGLSQDEAEAYASEFVADIIGESDILLPDGYYYKSTFKSAEATSHPAPWVAQLSVTLVGVRHGALISTTLTESGTITAQGNRTAPCRVTVSGITGDIEVMGISVTGITGSIVIDGIEATVTADGENAFLNTDITEWPSLSAGENTITFTAGVSVTIEYYPLYV